VNRFCARPALASAARPGLAPRRQPAGVHPVIRLEWCRRADCRNDGLCHALIVRAVPCLYGAFREASIFQIGVFSNKYMQYAVGLSIVLLLLVVSVPFLQPVFNTHFLSLNEWLVVLGLALIPAVAEEITKAYLRWKDKR
ncbi:MAG: hypothetical protein EHM70_06430, partial [Chloroflexota bacterium]